MLISAFISLRISYSVRVLVKKGECFTGFCCDRFKFAFCASEVA